jgi:hypothetical protein
VLIAAWKHEFAQEQVKAGQRFPSPLCSHLYSYFAPMDRESSRVVSFGRGIYVLNSGDKKDVFKEVNSMVEYAGIATAPIQSVKVPGVILYPKCHMASEVTKNGKIVVGQAYNKKDMVRAHNLAVLLASGTVVAHDLPVKRAKPAPRGSVAVDPARIGSVRLPTRYSGEDGSAAKRIRMSGPKDMTSVATGPVMKDAPSETKKLQLKCMTPTPCVNPEGEKNIAKDWKEKSWEERMESEGCTRCGDHWSARNKGFNNICLHCHHKNGYQSILGMAFQADWQDTLAKKLHWSAVPQVPRDPKAACFTAEEAYEKALIKTLWGWGEKDAEHPGLGYQTGCGQSAGRDKGKPPLFVKSSS